MVSKKELPTKKEFKFIKDFADSIGAKTDIKIILTQEDKQITFYYDFETECFKFDELKKLNKKEDK